MNSCCRTRWRATPPWRRRAFSLVELVAVAAIIAIMAGLALPHFADALARQRLAAASRQLAVDVEVARSNARTQGLRHRLRIVRAQSTYYLERTYDGTNWLGVPDPNNAALSYTVNLTTLHGVRIQSSIPLALSAIVFDAYGRPAQGVTIGLAGGRYAKNVIMEAETGRVRVEDAAAVGMETGLPGL